MAAVAATAAPFHTLKVSKEGNFMSPPAIRLGSDERIIVNFDEWADDYRDLQCRLVHCGPDWSPSRLLESEYAEGFNIADIDDWAFSTNTFVHYVNYNILIPGENINPLVSGNYILQIFERSEPDEILGEARFSVSEQSADITGTVSPRTDRGHNTEWQQLELALEPTDTKIDNPYSDLSVIVSQNGDPSSRRTLTTPSRVEGTRVIFDHRPELIFPAGNEFRRFESIRTNYADMHVDSVRWGGRNHHVWLTPDRERNFHQYSYDQTQQGRFLVREYSATDSNLGADYVTVHFTLETPEIIDADVYVEGEFTGWRLDETTRLRYDHEAQAYRTEIPMKQGSYNYRYTAVPRHGKRIPDSSLIEGNKYETRNEYQVEVWYSTPTSRAARLISTATLRNY